MSEDEGEFCFCPRCAKRLVLQRNVLGQSCFRCARPLNNGHLESTYGHFRCSSAVKNPDACEDFCHNLHVCKDCQLGDVFGLDATTICRVVRSGFTCMNCNFTNESTIAQCPSHKVPLDLIWSREVTGPGGRKVGDVKIACPKCGVIPMAATQYSKCGKCKEVTSAVWLGADDSENESRSASNNKNSASAAVSTKKKKKTAPAAKQQSKNKKKPAPKTRKVAPKKAKKATPKQASPKKASPKKASPKKQAAAGKKSNDPLAGDSNATTLLAGGSKVKEERLSS